MNYHKVILIALLLCTVFTGNASRAKSFEIDVQIGGQSVFTDCLVFDTGNRLRLTRGGLEMGWASDPRRADGTAFLATVDAASPRDFRLALHGEIVNRYYVIGNAVNHWGLTYTFVGKPSACALPESEAAARALPGVADYAGVPTDAFVTQRVAPNYGQYANLAERPIDMPCPYCEPIDPPWDLKGKPGHASAIAGGSFRVYLEPVGGKPLSDCWAFDNDGILRNSAGKQIWRMDLNNSDPHSFQTVAGYGEKHGMSFIGTIDAYSAVAISGVRVVKGKVTSYSGWGLPVRAC